MAVSLFAAWCLIQTGQAAAQQIAPQQPAPPDQSVLLAQGRPKTDEEIEFQIKTEMPGPEELFAPRLSEAQFYEQIRQEARKRPGSPKVIFPDDPPISKELYVARAFPRMTEQVEPCYVMHGRLLFEQRNFDRHGWDLGVFQPAVSLLAFYKDTLLLPYHCMTRPLQRYDSSAGKCLPGDPTPLLLYPPELSLTGLVGETAVVVGGFLAFP